MVFLTIQSIYKNESHISWTLLQYAFVRGIVAIKFLISARLLGPTEFALVAVALITLAIVESISDTGLQQAVIRSQEDPSKEEAGSIFTLQICRGILLALILFSLSDVLAKIYNTEQASNLIAFSALLPLIKNSTNIGLAVLARNRKFRTPAAIEIIASSIDISISIFLLFLDYNTISVLIGSAAGELTKLTASWLICRYDTKINFSWHKLGDIAVFGRTMWIATIITVAANQADKFLISNILGSEYLALYQTTSKIAQIAVSDISYAVGGFLLPTFAMAYHKSKESSKHSFSRALCIMAAIGGIITIPAIVYAERILYYALGADWVKAKSLLQFHFAAQFIAALIAICVPYAKAIGNPQIIAKISLFQLICILIFGYIFTQKLSGIGLISLSIIILAISFIAYLYANKKYLNLK